MAAPTSSIDILTVVRDGTTTRSWIRDSWARRKIALLNSKFSVLTGTCPAESGFSGIVAYPDGFTQDNSVIVSTMVYYASAWRAAGDGIFDADSRIFAAMYSTGVNVYSGTTLSDDLSWKVVLMRTDI